MVATDRYRAEKRINDTPSLHPCRDLLLNNQELERDDYWIANRDTTDGELIAYAQNKEERLERAAREAEDGQENRNSVYVRCRIPTSRGSKGSRGPQGK